MAKIAIGLFPLPVAAQPLAFFGDIGGAPVFVSLDRDGGKLSGCYLHISQARQQPDRSGGQQEGSDLQSGPVGSRSALSRL
jgi:hypothetical protein